MTESEITNFNKLCAEFLNVKGGFSSTYDVYFHSNWNWLMEVVDAIEALKFTSNTCTNRSPCFTIGKFSCYICIDNDLNKQTRLPIGGKYYFWSSGHHAIIEKTKKEAVVKAVTQFLNWYNDEGKIYIV